uniref:Uncharacterized protein n=1 Tax=Solibacter usitatus (strain Ellin6076) TaxID=234267 RepID=Q02A23_SOLUE
MLVEQTSPTRRRGKLPIWIWVTGGLSLSALAVVIIVFAAHWPFTREAVTAALESASGRQVQIGTFAKTYFPPGCTAGQVRFLRHKHPGAEPIISVEKLSIRATLTGLFGSPTHLSEVRVAGMHMIVAPNVTGENRTTVLLNSGPGGKGLAISKITADGAVLEFIHEDRKEPPYVIRVERLAVTNVGFGTPMFFRATVRNSEPPGVIRAEGKFGPWNPSDIGATPVSGTYAYDDIDLSFFESILGKGRAWGQFSDSLSRIRTRGGVEVSGFHLDGSDHAVQLATTFDATVNATNGDVVLNPAVASYRHTRIEVRGAIAAHQSEPGRTAEFRIAVPSGRVEDLLYLFTKGKPGMSGNVALEGLFVWPPGARKFLQKIRMDLTFGIKGSRFTARNTQDSINRISESAQGEEKKTEDSDPRIVLSQLQGKVRLRDGIAKISQAKFEVPGADAALSGSYGLLNQRIDLHGTLDTRGRLSDTTSGFKALVLKVVTPLFRKRHSARIIPFRITGAYGNESLGLDWKQGLLHSK